MSRLGMILGCAALVQGTSFMCKNVEDCCSKVKSQPPSGGTVANLGRGPTDRFSRLASDATTGWTDLPESKFHRFHTYLQLSVAATIPLYRVEPRVMQWGCADKIVDFNNVVHPIKTCTALVFIYNCGACKSAGQQALIAKLVADNWHPVHCAGYFRLKYNLPSYDHRFTLFYHEFSSTPTASSTLTVSIDEATEFIFWGQIHRDSEMCGQQDTEQDCLSGRTKDDCFWEGMECKPKLCPHPGGNPWAVGPGIPSCQTCVDEEVALGYLNQ